MDARNLLIPRFYDWLKGQAERDDPIGDLAQDAARDPGAPRDGSPEAWRCYLTRNPGAGWKARAALDQAIAEFRR